MELKLFEKHGVKLFYYINGKKPKVLIHSGTHGDEAGVVKLILVYLYTHQKKLPNFIWVPEVSPSAVARGCRKNNNGVDINRVWQADTLEPEVLANLALISDQKFEKFISFHEDCDLTDSFYIFDTNDREGSVGLENLRRAVLVTGAELYNGHDAPGGNLIKEGYFADSKVNGEAHVYLVRSGTAKFGLIPEIPMKASPEMKYRLIKVVFEQCLTWK